MAQIIFPNCDISFASDLLNDTDYITRTLKEIYAGNVEWIPSPEFLKNRIKERNSIYLRKDFWDYSERAKKIQEYSVTSAEITPYYIADSCSKYSVWRMNINNLWRAMKDAEENILGDFKTATLLKSTLSLKDTDPAFGYLYAHLISISILPLPLGEKSIKHHIFPYIKRAYGTGIASIQDNLPALYHFCKDIKDCLECRDLQESALELLDKVLLDLAQRNPYSNWKSLAIKAGLLKNNSIF